MKRYRDLSLEMSFYELDPIKTAVQSTAVRAEVPHCKGIAVKKYRSEKVPHSEGTAVKTKVLQSKGTTVVVKKYRSKKGTAF